MTLWARQAAVGGSGGRHPEQPKPQCPCGPPCGSPRRGVGHKVVQLEQAALAVLRASVVPHHPEAQHLVAVLQELLQALAVVLAAQQRLGVLGGGVGVSATQPCRRPCSRGSASRLGSRACWQPEPPATVLARCWHLQLQAGKASSRELPYCKYMRSTHQRVWTWQPGPPQWAALDRAATAQGGCRAQHRNRA